MEILIIGVILVVVLSSIRQINEYERGIKFRFGKFKKIMNPGWNLIFPVIDSFKKVDIRTRAVDVPEQEAITKDNVSIKINAVLYYKIFDASKAILAVENFNYAVSQLAQTTMRNAVGSVSLDELLSERDKISSEICKIVDEATDPWGIKVENVELKDISLPEEMKRVIARVAEAEREKDTSCSLHAWRTDDRLGTGSLYFLDTCGRQRRFYCSISECSIKKNVDDGMRLGKSHRDIGTDFR